MKTKELTERLKAVLVLFEDSVLQSYLKCVFMHFLKIITAKRNPPLALVTVAIINFYITCIPPSSTLLPGLHAPYVELHVSCR